MDWHDEQEVPGDWQKSTLLIFKVAITRYLQCLEPLKGAGNNSVDKEIDHWQEIFQRVNNLIKKLKHDDDSGKVLMLGKDYGKLYDIIWKLHSAKNQLLTESKRKVFEEVAHEGEQRELDNIYVVLQFSFWKHVTRHKAMVKSFYLKEEPQKETPNVSMQITIGNVYGQFAAINNGSMVQNNNTEAVEALRAITDTFVASKLPNQEKQEALLDIESMQSQLKKEKPNKNLLEAGLTSLQVAANTAQIISVVAPHFDKIQHFISTLSQM